MLYRLWIARSMLSIGIKVWLECGPLALYRRADDGLVVCQRHELRRIGHTLCGQRVDEGTQVVA